MTLVTPRTVNDVAYVTRIKHRSHFAWQAQYLVRLKCHFSGRRSTWSATGAVLCSTLQVLEAGKKTCRCHGKGADPTNSPMPGNCP